MAIRPRFDPKRKLVAARGFRLFGRDYAPGDAFPHPKDEKNVPERLRSRQYESRAVNMEPPAPADPVQMEAAGNGGRYTITAPWLDEPVKVRGKKKAEAELARIREEGAPLGWIEGGSEVTVEEQGGGWFEVNAPWLEEAEKVQGREDAEKRQREIHDAGAPEGGEGGNEDPDNAGSEKDGNATDGNASGAGEPEGAEKGADGENGGEGGQDPGGADEGAQDAQAVDVDALVTATHTGGGYYEIKAPWQAEAQKVRGKDDAEAARKKLVEAGPPEGWTPASD